MFEELRSYAYGEKSQLFFLIFFEICHVQQGEQTLFTMIREH